MSLRKFFEKQDPVNLGTIKLRRLTAFYSLMYFLSLLCSLYTLLSLHDLEGAIFFLLFGNVCLYFITLYSNALIRKEVERP